MFEVEHKTVLTHNLI